MNGLVTFVELEVVLRGTADPQTGYFVNIKHIDTAVRDHVQPKFAGMLAGDDGAPGTVPGLLAAASEALSDELPGRLVSLTYRATPFCSITHRAQAMDRVFLAQQFDFSAAHRLHVPGLSDEANRDTFGKCNNPRGHGHNYRVEVVVDSAVDANGLALEVAEIDRIVDERVIERLDHKHLNADVPAFGELNPSVEHIAGVVWDWLVEAFPAGHRLHEISVWETEKTRCTYRGGARQRTGTETAAETGGEAVR